MFENLFLPSSAVSRTITPENLTGQKGNACRARPDDPYPFSPSAAAAAAHLGEGWKVSPNTTIGPGNQAILAEIEGPGVVRHIWLTLDPSLLEDCYFKIRYDGGDRAIRVPVGPFFATGQPPRPSAGLAFATGNNGGLNCYLPMPFHKGIEISLENESATEALVYWAVDYTLEALQPATKCLFAEYEESDPVTDTGIHIVLPKTEGPGTYVGTFMVWQQHTGGWWGEGEMKFYIDGDDRYPTITSTGTEDYFGGAWNFLGGSYSAPYFGFDTVGGQNERAGGQHTMYRWHIPDPIYFEHDLRVTIQSLGWGPDRLYRIRHDTITSVAYWYGTAKTTATI